MTVNTTTNKARFVGNAAATTWPYTFSIPVASDLKLYYTDLLGATTLLDPSVYSVTGIGSDNGGIVTYPLIGSPIAAGTILEILRVVPYTQTVDLVNQDGFYPQVVEDALDGLEMQMQQLVEVQGRNLTVGATDTSPGELPSAAARANQLLGFDANGNATAAQPSSALVSTAMQPVVAAASLALGRTALGLGAMAVEGIGSGLADDGAGKVRTKYPISQDNSDQAVVVGFHATQRLATGALNYTLPAADTLFNGFGFWLSALTAAVTILLDAGDNFDGMSSGQSLIIPPGTQAFISTDGAASGLWSASFNQLVGLDSPLNLQINATVGSSALTISLKDRNGLAPSPTSPVLLAFRDPTITGGGPIIRALTAALSLTVPNGAVLGTLNATPFRLWVVLFDNAGTLVLGVILASDATSIMSLDVASPASGIAISAGSALAQTYYSASTITSKSFRILGYVEFNAGQVTAGAWVTAPSKIQLFGNGIKKPGDLVQMKTNSTAVVGSTSSAAFAALASGQTQDITSTSTINFIRALAMGSSNITTVGPGYLQLARGATLIGYPVVLGATDPGTAPISVIALDKPGSVATQTYGFQGKTASGTMSYPLAATGAYLQLEELMG